MPKPSPTFPSFQPWGAWAHSPSTGTGLDGNPGELKRSESGLQRRRGSLGPRTLSSSSSPWTHAPNPGPPAPPSALPGLGHHACRPLVAVGACWATGSASPGFRVPELRPRWGNSECPVNGPLEQWGGRHWALHFSEGVTEGLSSLGAWGADQTLRPKGRSWRSQGHSQVPGLLFLQHPLCLASRCSPG